MENNSISVEEVKKKIDSNQNFILLDIRTQKEREVANIKGSLFISMDELQERYEELDKSKEIIVYCHSGGRSAFVTAFLRSKEYNAKNMVGGIDDWSTKIDQSIPRY